MPISIRALRSSHPAFAGEVSGIDITRPIGREDVAAIEAGMDTYAVLVFRGQNLTDEQQLAFTLNFGVLERYKTPGHVRKREDNRLGRGIADFSNLDKQMWDNRATMHRARRFDRNEVRDVRRTTLAGNAPTVEQEPVA